MKAKTKALLSITACVFFWGFSFISIKIAVAVFPPMTLGALRFAIAFVFLFFIKRKFAPLEKIKKQDIPLLAGAGLTGVTLYFFFENNGVLLIPASEASIIIAAIPVIILVAEGLKDKIMHKKNALDKKFNTGKKVSEAVGAFLSISGVVLVAGVSFSLSGSLKGYFFMAGACLSWVFYCFLTRPLFEDRSRIYIVYWQTLAGLIGFLPFIFFEPSPDMPSFAIWGHVIFLGIFCSALGYWFYAIALETLGVTVSAIFINFIPVISAIGGFVVLKEHLQPLQWLGAALVLAGVYLAAAFPIKYPALNGRSLPCSKE